MRKEDFERFLCGDWPAINTGSIEDHLDALAAEWCTPVVALGVCLVRIEESAPFLRDLIERAADGEALTDEDSQLLFRGQYILGAARDTLAFQPI